MKIIITTIKCVGKARKNDTHTVINERKNNVADNWN
jgi:hypothetical protein